MGEEVIDQLLSFVGMGAVADECDGLGNDKGADSLLVGEDDADVVAALQG